MQHKASDISFKGRLRIIILVVLSLVSGASYILPPGMQPGNFQESPLYEQETAEACKVSLGIAVSVKIKRSFSKQPFPGLHEAVAYRPQAVPYQGLASWLRPAYYIFLHRFSLF